MSLDLNDLEIQTTETDESTAGLDEYSDGHGLNEIGASCQSGSNSCGQGSCQVQMN
jgi:hypothetical protein